MTKLHFLPSKRHVPPTFIQTIQAEARAGGRVVIVTPAQRTLEKTRAAGDALVRDLRRSV